VLYWRTAIEEEVDFLIEAGSMLLPIEVKATARPGLATRNTFVRSAKSTAGAVGPGWCCTPVMRSSGSRRVSWPRHGGRCFEGLFRVLNTCLYQGFPADLADREEVEIP
jgi:hypothetical protein